jgi:pilus assembly protein CpaF
VTQIAVVSGMEVDLITMQDIFTYRHEGFDKDGNALGRFAPTGVIPRFVEDLAHRGERANLSIFRDEG